MLSFDDYKNGKSASTLGEVRKQQSDIIMEATWDGDIGAKKAYIYDYYHDDEPLVYYPMHPQKSNTKTMIDIKFIINAYNSENKDQVGYHIQFKPGQKCPLDYYDSMFVKKYGSEFPIGLFIDIPDEQGVYRKWLITENANAFGLQFPTYYVLPIDYLFQWIHNNKKYQMCGVGRSQSSYNQGTWVDFNLWFTKNLSLCWNTLRALIPKRKDEICLNGNGLKSLRIGQSAGKMRIA